jgi:hypothetical protein
MICSNVQKGARKKEQKSVRRKTPVNTYYHKFTFSIT